MKPGDSRKKCSCYSGFDCPICNPDRYAKTPNEWLSVMGKSGVADAIPEGWLTLRQMAAESGIPFRTIMNRADTMVRNGKLQRQQFQVTTPVGVRLVWHYFPKKTP